MASASNGLTPEPTRFVFVTGASRSGTTMLSRVLGGHSQILSLRELHYFGDLFDPTSRERAATRDLERLAAAILARQAREVWGRGATEPERRRARDICAGLKPEECTGHGVLAAVLSQLAAESGKHLVCEQTPRNIFYAREILANLPGSAIIHIVRDPRAVVASQKNRWKLRLLGAKHVPISELIRTRVNYHPLTMAKLWRDATRAALRLRGEPRALLVRFEDFVANPTAQAQAACDFLGVPFEPQMTLVPQWGSSNVRHEDRQTQLSTAVLDQWKSVLTSGEVRIVDRVAADLLDEFSYDSYSSTTTSAVSVFPYALSYPLHLAGVALVNPRRAWIQLRAALLAAGGRNMQ